MIAHDHQQIRNSSVQSGRDGVSVSEEDSSESGRQEVARFSLWDYATRFRSSVEEHPAGYMRDEDHRSPSSRQGKFRPAVSREQFQSIVEDMRAYLVGMYAQTEEEQIEYGNALNRAVLGYTKERQAFYAIIQDRLASRRLHLLEPPLPQYETMAEAVFAQVIGLNVLESVLRDRGHLEEIQVVGTRIFEVRDGAVQKSKYRFRSVDEVERLQQNLVLYNRDSINSRKPWAEVSLPDGARVTMTGFGYTREPTITIRFFPLREASLDRLARPPYETLDDDMVTLLQAIVAARLNLIVIGATNTGKSHLLKALIAHIPDEQRIVTIESRFELQLGKQFPEKNIVEFEAPDDDEMQGGRQAFRLALRQSPERIILAEIRDQEANLYVRSCTRGHTGSMTTAHVNRLEDVPDAITDMCMLDKRGMNPDRLRRRIARFVTQIGIEMKIVAGKRKIVRIGEICEEDGQVYVHDLVVYDYEANTWRRCNRFSQMMSERIRQEARDSYEALMKKGWVSE